MAEQLFHVGVKAVIRNEQGQILLQAFVNEHGSISMWDLPGGRMDDGETFGQTLARELKEEIGVDYNGEPVFIMPILANVKIPVGDDKVSLVMLAYEVDLNDADVPVAQEDGSVIEWVTPAVAAERLRIKFSSEFCDYVAKL